MQIKLICVVVLPFRISGITSLQENNVIATDWMFFSHRTRGNNFLRIQQPTAPDTSSPGPTPVGGSAGRRPPTSPACHRKSHCFEEELWTV